ncbi:hypothetical protein C1I95_24720 [Micromonospora craterilacus]|uniref:Uncharacterized protein n=1 Tax=Micromonospora craterilacus TaxID=1655439 RepID=A0A2W2DLZ2_9ACTN|nr:hypothetical protein C1I95_24720 [Micromonospora craterilacus]
MERTDHTARVLYEVARERSRQDAKFGPQNHPDGTGPRQAIAIGIGHMGEIADQMRRATNAAAGRLPGLEHHGPLTWRHVLLEEVFEALAEDDPAKLRTELVQVAATATVWIEAIDRRLAKLAAEGTPA